MCNYFEVLSTSEHGEISISDCKNCFKVQFGNLMIMQNYDAYLGFLDNVQHCNSVVYKEVENTTRDICFSTKLPHMHIQFSAKEIGELCELLENAMINYEINV